MEGVGRMMSLATANGLYNQHFIARINDTLYTTLYSDVEDVEYRVKFNIIERKGVPVEKFQ